MGKVSEYFRERNPLLSFKISSQAGIHWLGADQLTRIFIYRGD